MRQRESPSAAVNAGPTRIGAIVLRMPITELGMEYLSHDLHVAYSL